MDDLLFIFPAQRVIEILDKLNSFYTRLKFTIEEENDGKLPYLDILIIRNDDNHIAYDWARTNFIESNTKLPFTTTGKTKRKLHIEFNESSDPSTCFHKKNSNKVREILVANSYPNKLIQRLIRKQSQRVFHDNHQSIASHNNTHTVSSDVITPSIYYRRLPYIVNVTEKVAHLVKHNVPDIKAAICSSNSLGKSIFTNTKQKIEKMDQIDVVYEIPCAGDSVQKCNLTYVGHTKNKLKKRLNQHANDLKNPNKNSGKTAIVHHYDETGHRLSFDRARVLTVESNYSKRLTFEYLNILTRYTYNLRCDTESIPAIYHTLLK